jgi:hypothetical protein
MRPVSAVELSDALCNVSNNFLSLQVVYLGILSDKGEECSFVVRIDQSFLLGIVIDIDTESLRSRAFGFEPRRDVE